MLTAVYVGRFHYLMPEYMSPKLVIGLHRNKPYYLDLPMSIKATISNLYITLDSAGGSSEIAPSV
jgi:hypothetical protein